MCVSDRRNWREREGRGQKVIEKKREIERVGAWVRDRYIPCLTGALVRAASSCFLTTNKISQNENFWWSIESIYSSIYLPFFSPFCWYPSILLTLHTHSSCIRTPLSLPQSHPYYLSFFTCSNLSPSPYLSFSTHSHPTQFLSISIPPSYLSFFTCSSCISFCSNRTKESICEKLKLEKNRQKR